MKKVISAFYIHGTGIVSEYGAVSKVTDTASYVIYTKQSPDFPKPELCHVPDFLYLWTYS